MEHTSVQSRDIAIVGYEKATGTLEVAFRRGGVYRYEAIPDDLYRNFMAADSLGIYFNQNIKDRFPCVKVN